MNAANLKNAEANDSWLEVVRRHAASLDFGVVHGSRVVQIEKTEKVRLSHRIARSPEHL